MGYVHDTAMSQFIPVNACSFVTGTWADAAGAVAGTVCKSRTAADASTVISIPITIPQNSASYKGSKLVSIDIWWECLTAANDALAAAINHSVLPATGDAFAAITALAFSYDTGHDTAGERLTLDQHKMTLTLTTPKWLDNDDLILVQITIDAAATSAITFFGARANFTLRV
jgi:hypothetical protein